MEGFAHIICGATGTGKTTFAKSLLQKFRSKSRYIYDVNNEYNGYSCNDFGTFQEFTELIEPVKNSLILFEEATIFLHHHNTNKILIDKLVRKRHDNNIILLNFHSLRKIPVYILDLSNYITLFKTIDTLHFVESKFSDTPVISAYNTVNNSANKHCNLTFKLY